MPCWLRTEQTRLRVQLLPRPVDLPARLSSAAIEVSLIWRARTRTRSMTSASVDQRVRPARFFLTLRRVWSPPLPVDDQLQHVASHVHDDLLDHGPDDPLAGLRRGA